MGDDTTRGETLEANDMDDDRELDVEGSPASSREPAGREEYRNREDYGGSGSTGTAATGGMSDLETGERDREEGTQTGGSPTDEGGVPRGIPRRLPEGQREGAGGGVGGEGQGASRYSGCVPLQALALEEFGDTEAYRSGSTGGQPSRGETLDRGSSERDYEQGGEDARGRGVRTRRKRRERGHQGLETHPRVGLRRPERSPRVHRGHTPEGPRMRGPSGRSSSGAGPPFDSRTCRLYLDHRAERVAGP
jgi:hypothetical protein